jgi:cyclic pyranopterin phosphate synthase
MTHMHACACAEFCVGVFGEAAALTHVDAENMPTMVDVGAKQPTQRSASARSIVRLPPVVSQLFAGNDINTKKGPVFATAVIAGTMAAKRTSDLIPFCHPLALEKCNVKIELHGNDVHIVCDVQLSGKTGVEMEALTGASVAALTVYDMCKALSHEITIAETKLLHKSGGKSDYRAQ